MESHFGWFFLVLGVVFVFSSRAFFLDGKHAIGHPNIFFVLSSRTTMTDYKGDVMGCL